MANAAQRATAASTRAAPRAQGATETIILRNAFYRDNFRMLVASLGILSIALFVSIVGNVIQANKHAENHYMAVDGAGRLLAMPGLSEPYVDDTKLRGWAADRVSKALMLDHLNYTAQVQASQQYFTPTGYVAFVEALKTSGFYKMLADNYLSATAAPTGDPIIRQQGLGAMDGQPVYFWKVSMPMLVSLRSKEVGNQMGYNIDVLIVRRSTLETSDALGIEQIVLNPTK